MDKKKAILEKIILESNYPYSMVVYKLIHHDYFKKTLPKIDNIGVPCNVNPKEITSADEQFLQLLNRFIEFFDDTFYFLHIDSYCYIHLIIETNYENMEKYLLSKHYLGDNNYIEFFQDSIYRIIVSNFIKNVTLSKTLEKLLKKESIACKRIEDYSLSEILKIKNLLAYITLANIKNKFSAIVLFDDINKAISQIEQILVKNKLKEKDILNKKEIILNNYLFKIDLLIEEYEKKKKYLTMLNNI